MKINCQNEKCGYVINIPDNKIPSRPVRIACPQCKTPNVVNPPKAAATPVAGAGAAPSPGGRSEQDALYTKIMGAVEQRLAAFRLELASGAPGVIPASAGIISTGEVAGIKKALICDDDAMMRKVIKDSVEELGYVAEDVSTIEKSIAVLNKPEVEYDLILIDKVFPDDSEGGYKILSKVATLPLDMRRNIFVVFISGDIKSGDASSAFLMGANTVVNKKDINKLGAILESEMAEYKRLYKVFNQCLHLSKTYRH